jgi:hypothetical protein
VIAKRSKGATFEKQQNLGFVTVSNMLSAYLFNSFSIFYLKQAMNTRL